ncbi:unnamed protein product, partial [Meganyctiphanes norvegica]
MAWDGSNRVRLGPLHDADIVGQTSTVNFEDHTKICANPNVSDDLYHGGALTQDTGNYSIEEEVKQNEERNADIVVWEITTLVLIFVLTVFGNVLVMVLLMIRRKKLTRMCYFILSLCVSDLITALMNVLPQIAWEITHRFKGGDFLCRAVKFGQILGPYLSSYLLVMTALDRYQAICYPLSNCSWSPRHAKNMILMATFLSLACCIPQLFIFRYTQLHNGEWECWASFAQFWGARAYVTWYVISVFIIPLIILIVVYTSICRCLYVNFKLKQPDEKPKQKVHESRRPNLVHSVRGISRAKIKTVKLTVTVIACYITCSMPFSVAQLWSVWDVNAASSPFYSATLFIILLTHHLQTHINFLFMCFN